MKDKILLLLRENSGFLSGQEISEKLGVSRTAIWKVINQLKAEGYQIEAVRNKGYYLAYSPDILDKNEISAMLKSEWAGSEIVVLDQIDSTNNEVKRLAENGASHGLLVAAEKQTAGKGRRGRSWDSETGQGITMSLLLRPDIEPSQAPVLTLVSALAVRKALVDTCGIDPLIKWPNDLVCDGKKVCGILTEMSAQIDFVNYIVIGIGINVSQEGFQGELEKRAVSINQIAGTNVRRNQIIAKTMNAFEHYYNEYIKTKDLTYLVDEYNSYLVNMDREVRVLNPMGEYDGVARGITPGGDLIVETEGQIKHVTSGEVSVRGIYGYV